TAKMVAAVALGRHDTADTLYCRAPLPGSVDFGDARACRRKSAWISARQAFARSDNQAVNWRLRRVPPSELRTTADKFLLPSFGATPPSTALTLGTVEITPAKALQVAQAIGNGLSGSTDNVSETTILDDVMTIEENGKLNHLSVSAPPAIRGED